jgi:nicotinamidase-related amidase
MKYTNFIAVDLQNDFTTKGGLGFEERPSVDFVKNTVTPYFEKNRIKLSEIVSDYRQPRPGDSGDCCHPNTWGYESIIPNYIKKDVWVKCMNSPIWVRDNIGTSIEPAGIPHQDGAKFQLWLDKNIGGLNLGIDVVLFGLTVDCCVLSTAQELCWRGYKVHILRDAVDTYSGRSDDKELVLDHTPLLFFADVVNWNDLL